MNNRIQELVEQATERSLDIGGTRELTNFNKEKFADLIVKECADFVSKCVVRDKGHTPRDPHSVGWNSAIAYANKELKKQFKIKE